MEADELKQYVYSRIDELPTLPAVVVKVLGLLEDPDVDAGNLADLISRDPALTAKVLKVANSAYYGFSAQIDSLRHAVPLLGLSMTKSLALSIGVMEALPGVEPRPWFSEEGLWRHSIGVAIMAHEMSRRYGGGGDHLFVAGLLHDVGKIVLDRFFGEQFSRVLEAVNTGEGLKLHEAARQTIGMDHCQVAAMLLERWRFPPSILTPIAHLHLPGPLEGADGRDVALLRVANVMAQEYGLGPDGNPRPNPLRHGDLELLGLGQTQLTELGGYGETVRDEVAAFWGAVS